MKFFVIIILAASICFSNTIKAQQDLHTTAKALMKEGDYENACLVLNKLLNTEPENIAAKKDYAFATYYKKDYKKSIDITKQLTADSTNDDQLYQLLAMNYKALANTNEFEKILQNAIIKFPANGYFYNEIGEKKYINKQPDSAIKFWEKGIQNSPNYASNYYNAAMYYSTKSNLFWAVYYGEIFVNLESYTVRTVEVKSLIVEAYKKLLNQSATTSSVNKFEKKFAEVLGNNSDNITASLLSSLRTKFILQWFYDKNNDIFPCQLFSHQQYLLQEGMFEAYNQWLFGVILNPVQYKVWVDGHKVEAKTFEKYQQSKIFKIPEQQYYNNN